MFAGAESYLMPLREGNGWLPELDAIPPDVARAARVMWAQLSQQPHQRRRQRGRSGRGHGLLPRERHRAAA